MSTSAQAVLAILMICYAVSNRYNYLPSIKKTNDKHTVDFDQESVTAINLCSLTAFQAYIYGLRNSRDHFCTIDVFMNVLL